MDTAYQVAGFAYQGSGQFAYQGEALGTATLRIRTIHGNDLNGRDDWFISYQG